MTYFSWPNYVIRPRPLRPLYGVVNGRPIVVVEDFEAPLLAFLVRSVHAKGMTER